MEANKRGSQEGAPPLVVHIINRLALGGLENGLVNLINHMPPERYRHAIVCLTDYTDFRNRIQRSDVPIVALHKKSGQDFGLSLRLIRIFLKWRPAIVHTRNLASLEFAILATLAGVPGRVHGEHGRDMYDLFGKNRKYNMLRKVVKIFIHKYIAVSADLTEWLINTIGIPSHRVTNVYNGVDQNRFSPRQGARPSLGPSGFATDESIVIGTVGRLEPVKDQMNLFRAFQALCDLVPNARNRLRLMIIGDGSLLKKIRQSVDRENMNDMVWVAGECSNIPEIMRALDIFVLPSVGEGISNTILEAMATGLPVLATRVGGNSELVDQGLTGDLVPASDPSAMAHALLEYVQEPKKIEHYGRAGRKKVENYYSLEKMVDAYLQVYDSVIHRNSEKKLAIGAPSVNCI